jgi:hypothetical protein
MISCFQVYSNVVKTPVLIFLRLEPMNADWE